MRSDRQSLLAQWELSEAEACGRNGRLVPGWWLRKGLLGLGGLRLTATVPINQLAMQKMVINPAMEIAPAAANA